VVAVVLVLLEILVVVVSLVLAGMVLLRQSQVLR
jgi:hypothetical protein